MRQGKRGETGGTVLLKFVSRGQGLDEYVRISLVVGDSRPKSRYKRRVLTFYSSISLRMAFSRLMFYRQDSCTMK